MDNVKNDLYYIKKIYSDLYYINNHMEAVDSESFSNNELLQDSMMFRLIQISENSRKLSESFQKAHPSIPWIAIYGLRNRIVHDYGRINLNIIYGTLKNDIPELFKLLSEELD